MPSNRHLLPLRLMEQLLNPIVQVNLSHVTLQFLCKLLLAGIVIAATLPGMIHSYSISPAVIATLLAGQVHRSI